MHASTSKRAGSNNLPALQGIARAPGLYKQFVECVDDYSRGGDSPEMVKKFQDSAIELVQILLRDDLIAWEALPRICSPMLSELGHTDSPEEFRRAQLYAGVDKLGEILRRKRGRILDREILIMTGNWNEERKILEQETVELLNEEKFLAAQLGVVLRGGKEVWDELHARGAAND